MCSYLKLVKLNLNYIFVVAITIFLASCSSKPTSYKLDEIKNCVYPDYTSESAPMWICRVPITGYPAIGIGSTPPSKAGINFMTQKAAVNARVDLAQTLKTQVNSKFTDFIKSEGLEDEESINRISKLFTEQITSNMLIGAKILRTATSPKGTLYVLVGLDSESQKATINSAFNKANNKMNAKSFSDEKLSKLLDVINQ